MVQHKYYTLSYIENYEQAEWVCYPLTKEILRRPNFPRSDWFDPDPMVSTASATHYDYKGSGYTRGHLAPAGDMSFAEDAMKESFYMSNMSPQLRGFNNGVWRELEEQSRDWVYQNGEVYIVSGPIFDNNPARFKRNKIAVPKAFYKIILDVKDPVRKGIAFVIPHEVSVEPLSSYATTIDKVEDITGINFFARFLPHQIESLESKTDLSLWPISEDRYRLRVERWNKE